MRVKLEVTTTISPDLRVLNAYRFDPDPFSDLAVPTGLITGSESTPLFQTSTVTFTDGLANSRHIALPGQTHEAVTGATAFFATTVTSHLQA